MVKPAIIDPEIRAKAPAGVSLASLKTAKASVPSSLPDGLSADLARILRPNAAYRWMMPQLAAITPQYIEMVLRGALAGSHVQAWELFDLMEDSWPRLNKNLNDVKRAAQNWNWKLKACQVEDEPPTDSATERMKLVSAALLKMQPDPAADENALDGTIYDILDARAKGLSVLETEWHMRNAGKLGDIIAPRSTCWVHPTCYAFNQEGRLGLRMESGARSSGYGNTAFSPLPGLVQEFPENKFLIAICKSKSGSPLGGALLRPLAWWWCAANFSADWLLNLAQIFGLPFRWANYATGAGPDVVDKICSMLERMGSAGWAAFPEGTQLEFKEAGKAGDASPQGDMLDRADKQCDLLVLGQTLTSDVGNSGSRALGDVHMSVRGDIIESSTKFAAEIINRQLIPAILRLNYGDTEEAPEICAEPDKIEDQTANATRDKTLIEAGVQIPKKWFYKRHDIPLPQEGEKTIGGLTAVLPPTGSEGLDQPPTDGTKKQDVKQGADVQATALNGAQVDALASLAEQVAAGLLPLESAKAIATAAFPLVPIELIEKIFASLKNFEPKTPEAPTPAAAPDAKTIKAKSADEVNAELVTNATDEFAQALATDLEPVRQQLQAILEIQDPEIQKARLIAFLEKIDQMKADLSKDPASAHALQNILAAGLANGMAAAKETQA